MKKDKKENYIKSLKKEIANVKWPNGKDMLKYTIATLAFVVFFGGYFYLINFLFALLKGMFN